MHLLVGLGNPGAKYAGNRHNIGFMAIDAIAAAHAISGWKSKYAGRIAEGDIGGARVLLLKPETFMNRSGDSVQQTARFFKIAPADIVVFYDELDLVPGKVRVKIGGGNGGHNGLRSIDPQIGRDYKRVRIGIGHPGKDFVTAHVLGDFAKADRTWLDPLLEGIGRHAGLLLEGNDNGFMNKLAVAASDGEPPAAKKPAPASDKGQTPPRPSAPPALPKTAPKAGPMAEMLNKLLGKG